LKLDLLRILVVNQCLQANVVKDLLLSALQNHGRHNARLHGLNPTKSANAPPITRLQTRKLILGPRSYQVSPPV
jgi:hypothetical protein